MLSGIQVPQHNYSVLNPCTESHKDQKTKRAYDLRLITYDSVYACFTLPKIAYNYIPSPYTSIIT